MDKTQEEKFEKAYEATKRQWPEGNETFARLMFMCGLAANSEANGIGEEPRIPEGYFKIGENVEANVTGAYYEPCIVTARRIKQPHNTEHPEDVRRIHAWKPRDGEAVLVGLCDESGRRFAQAGVYADGIIHGMGDEVSYEAVPCIPFDESKRGKPWSEI